MFVSFSKIILIKKIILSKLVIYLDGKKYDTAIFLKKQNETQKEKRCALQLMSFVRTLFHFVFFSKLLRMKLSKKRGVFFVKTLFSIMFITSHIFQKMIFGRNIKFLE